METLLLPVTGEVHCLHIESIVRIEASSNYSKVYCQGTAHPIVAAKLLRWFEERLPQEFFFRVHRTHLINRKYLVTVHNNTAVLESGEQVCISRRKRKQIVCSFV
jgi:two-component system, LytTR family, response regulator